MSFDIQIKEEVKKVRDLNKLCMGCMREKPGTGICPYCHFSIEKYEVPIYHLKPQTILSGQYLIGQSIGEGGFGITYIGWDLNLEIPLAIKEYFPKGFAVRDYHVGDHVTAFSGEKARFYKAEREKFVQEAKSLAKFYRQEEIVRVHNYFQENGTAYIVMEYIVGKTYADILKEREENGNFSAEEVFETMKPVIKALGMIHKEGVVHRDISPSNIMITEEGKAKMIDFGAARGFSDGEKSLSIILKAGYAPEEQYRSRGIQGPWTDVYALCATIYRAITGSKPPDSMERLSADTIKRPSELGVKIDRELEDALMKGLSVRAENRWQSMEELYEAFYETKNRGNSGEMKIPNTKGIPESSESPKQPEPPKPEPPRSEPPRPPESSKPPIKKKFPIKIIIIGMVALFLYLFFCAPAEYVVMYGMVLFLVFIVVAIIVVIITVYKAIRFCIKRRKGNK